MVALRNQDCHSGVGCAETLCEGLASTSGTKRKSSQVFVVVVVCFTF